MTELPPEEVKPFQNALLDYFHKEHEDVLREFAATGELSDELRQKIAETARGFLMGWKEGKSAGTAAVK